MCGRFSLSKSKEKIKRRFQLDAVPDELMPRYNIAPSQMIPAILNEAPQQLKFLRWGLIPHWASPDKISSPLINARAETITEKPAFRQAVALRRCLIIADGFYEWKREGKKKRPFRVVREDEDLFAFAGIWEVPGKSGSVGESCAIITLAASPDMRKLHDRMPFILPKDQEREWLTPMSLDDIRSILTKVIVPKLKMWEVTAAINSPNQDTADLMEPMKS